MFDNIDITNLPNTAHNYLFQRILHDYRKHNNLIIAYDFDDTVKPYYSSGCEKVCSVLRSARDNLNAFFIVTTINGDINKVKKYLDEYDIPYDAINENAPFVSQDIKMRNPRKIYCNILFDDKAGLSEPVDALETLIHLVVNSKIKGE